MPSEAVINRRRIAALMREKKQEEIFMQQLADKSKNDNSSIPVISKDKIDKIDKIKRTRMQNAIGTSGMFIKP
tara:strand:+ start:1134 stop:1352 length:219 start_codon:yes stop_codon:yes gene_type:complete